MKKRVISFFLICMLLLSVLPLVPDLIVSAKADDGSFGDDLLWRFNPSSGILTISGTGVMPDFDEQNLAPWAQYRNDITDLLVLTGAKNIGANAFRNCKNLFAICLPNSVTEIGAGAFSGCEALESVELPKSVETIAEDAFVGCKSLRSFTVESGSTAFCFDEDGALYTKDRTKLVAFPRDCADTFVVPYGVTEIGPYAFYGSNLKSVSFSSSVTAIDAYAFSNSELTQVVLPTLLSSIGEGAFSGCETLTKVHFLGNCPTISDSAFQNCAPDLRICRFDNATGWDGVQLAEAQRFSAEQQQPTCTEEGCRICSCDVCGVFLEKPIAAKGHSFVDGVCKECNAKLNIESASLRLDQDINIVYTATVPEGFEAPYMTFTYCGSSFTVSDYTKDGNGKYCFVFPKLVPQCMGEEIDAELHATLDGQEYTDSISDYSVRSYCRNMLNKYPDDAALKTLLSDLLTYGAAAQTYTGNSAAPVTEGLTLTPSAFPGLEKRAVHFTGEADPEADWTSATLVLSNALGVRFTFRAASVEDLLVQVTLNGRLQIFDKQDFVQVPDREDIWYITFKNIEATELDDPITAGFCRDGDNIDRRTGRSVIYSVNTYISQMQDTQNAALTALIRTLYNYGAAAKAYETATALPEDPALPKGDNWYQVGGGEPLPRPYEKEWGYYQCKKEGTDEAYDWMYRCIYEGFAAGSRTLVIDGVEQEPLAVNGGKYLDPRLEKLYQMQMDLLMIPLRQFSLTRQQVKTILDRVTHDNPLLLNVRKTDFVPVEEDSVCTAVGMTSPQDSYIAEYLPIIENNLSLIYLNKVYQLCRVNPGDPLTEQQRWEVTKVLHDTLIERGNYCGDIGKEISQYWFSTIFPSLREGEAYLSCEGASTAMKFLCQQYGINCLCVYGEASNDHNMGGHDWNMLSLTLDYGDYEADPAKWTGMDALWDSGYEEGQIRFDGKQGNGWLFFCSAEAVFGTPEMMRSPGIDGFPVHCPIANYHYQAIDTPENRYNDLWRLPAWEDVERSFIDTCWLTHSG